MKRFLSVLLAFALVLSGVATLHAQDDTLIPNPKVVSEDQFPDGLGTSGGSVVVDNVDNPRSFNPIIQFESSSDAVNAHLHAPLLEVNPAQGIKRVFSQKSLVEAVKSLLKILLLGLILVLVVWALLGDILESPACGLACVRELTFRASIIIFILGALVFVVESLFDLWYQKQQFIRDNMMSKDEVKRDQKNTEGDPLLKGERQSRARELTETDLKQAIADATLAIRTGDRVILLEYEAGRTPLPFILLKEGGESATQVLAAARRRELPIEEEHALGRRLWREGRVNQYIPRSTIEDLGRLFARRGATTGKG